jgi:hypothetical protein
MLTPYVNSQFVEKIMTDRSGRQFKLTFLVAIVDGQLKGRLVSAQPLAQSFKNTESVVFLPISCPKNETVTEYAPAFAPIVSPYNELFFFTSQPTRAPSYK